METEAFKICFDIDGTICENKIGKQTYADVKPLPGAVEALKRFKKEGFYIILLTARHMRTCEANEGKVLANIGYIYAWLDKWEIPYDELRIGKPHAELFIDDKGYRHENWTDTERFITDFYKGTKKHD
jgi:capsule biosynthesis phosphatase